MNKIGVIIGVIVIAIIAGVAVSMSSSPSETVNLDMEDLMVLFLLLWVLRF